MTCNNISINNILNPVKISSHSSKLGKQKAADSDEFNTAGKSEELHIIPIRPPNIVPGAKFGKEHIQALLQHILTIYNTSPKHFRYNTAFQTFCNAYKVALGPELDSSIAEWQLVQRQYIAERGRYLRHNPEDSFPYEALWPSVVKIKNFKEKAVNRMQKNALLVSAGLVVDS